MLLRHLYEEKARSIVAIMPGGFHPFHPGHKSLYDWAVKTFGQNNVYVAATNDTSARPFPFDVKKKLANMAGVPSDRFIQVKAPFNLNSYKELLGPETAIVFVRSLKDKGEHPLPDQTKKDGTPGYLKTYTGKDLDTAVTSGYMAYGPTIDFDFSGLKIKSASELRATWPNMSDEEKLQAAKLMYGNGATVAVQLLNQALGSVENEAIGKDELVKNMAEKQRQRMTNQVLQYLDKLVKKDNTKDIAGHAYTLGREVNLGSIGLDSKSLVQLYKSQYPIGEKIDKRSMSGDTKSFRYTSGVGRLPTVNTTSPSDITKKSKRTDFPDGSYEIDFDNLDKEKLKKVVAKLIPTLGHKKNEMVLRARFGLAPFEREYTLKQIADAMGVTPEVVRQREAKALRQLRHVSRSRELRPFLDSEQLDKKDIDKFHNELDRLVHKYFGSSPDEEKKMEK